MNKTTIYIMAYIFTYIILSIFYGIAQWYFVCTDMQGFECNFNETKYISFLTVTAYIVTPIVVIFGFQAWKVQHEKTILSTEAKELWLLLDAEERSYRELKKILEKSIKIMFFKENSKFKREYEQNTERRKLIEENISRFYNLSQDFNISRLGINYRNMKESYENFYSASQQSKYTNQNISLLEEIHNDNVRKHIKYLKKLLHNYIFPK